MRPDARLRATPNPAARGTLHFGRVHAVHVSPEASHGC